VISSVFAHVWGYFGNCCSVSFFLKTYSKLGDKTYSKLGEVAKNISRNTDKDNSLKI